MCQEKVTNKWVSVLSRAFNAFPTYILIDHEGVIRYRGMGSGLQVESEVSERTKKALRILAASPNRQKGKSAESSTIITAQPVPASSSDSGGSAPTPGIFRVDYASPKTEDKRIYVLNIPKPVIEVTAAESPNSTSQPQNGMVVHRLRIRNWASLPDDLFAPSKNLMACRVGAIGPIADSASTRLEIIIRGEQGQMLRAY
jgi:hypothetical protein